MKNKRLGHNSGQVF